MTRYKAEFIAVYEARGCQILRVLIITDRADTLKPYLTYENKKIADGIYIGWPEGEDNLKDTEAVYSFKVPTNQEFPVKCMVGGKKICKCTFKQYDALVRLRNCVMVNPEIDGYYKVLQKQDMNLGKAGAAHIEDDDPMFSIVTPLYNSNIIYLEDLYKCFKNQTYNKLEWILVNGSSDNKEIVEFLNDISDENIHVIATNNEGGIVGNTNAGIKTAKGDFVAFIDHDDLYADTLFEEYANEIRDRDDVSALYCDEDVIEADFRYGDSGCRFLPRFKPDINYPFLLTHNYVVHMLCIKRSDLFEISLSDTKVSGAQDYDLTLKLIERNKKVVHVPEILYHWRKHKDSLTNSTSINFSGSIACKVALKGHAQRMGLDIDFEETEIPYVYKAVLPGNISYKIKVQILYLDGLIQYAGCLRDMNGNFIPVNQNLDPTLGGGYLGYAACLCEYSDGVVSPYDPISRIGPVYWPTVENSENISSFKKHYPKSQPIKRQFSGIDKNSRFYNSFISYDNGYPQLEIGKFARELYPELGGVRTIIVRLKRIARLVH